jgi:gliding motility-associated-like protein
MFKNEQIFIKDKFNKQQKNTFVNIAIMQHKTKIFILLWIVLIQPMLAQNLVPNPSFEQLTSCPISISEVDKAFPWVAPTDGTSDLYHVCTNTNPNPSFVEVPNNILGYQVPQNGQGYTGYFAYIPGNGYKEYIETQLSTPLVVGETYCVSYYVSLSNNSTFAVNGLGAYFATNSISANPLYAPGSGFYNVLPVTPQIIFNQVISDTLNWVKLSATFTPTQPYQYMVLGCFYNDSLITTNPVIPSSAPPEGDCSYYYTDQISVELASPNGQLAISASNINVCLGQSVSLYATGSNGGAVNWADGQTGDTITYTPTLLGLQTILAISDVDCNSYSGSIDINVIDCSGGQLTLTITEDTICKGDTTSITVIGGSDYIWNNGNTNETIFVSPQSTTNYSVSGIIGGNIQTIAATITVLSINAQASYNVIDEFTVTFVSETPTGYTGPYYWSFGDGATSTDENPTHVYPGPGTYNAYLILENNARCIDTVFFTVTVENINTVYFPNSFTPDGDGVNEVFFAKGTNFTKTSLTIFNSWGEQLYAQEGSPNTLWNGTYKGQKCMQGVYVFKFDVQYTNGISENYVGKIILLR